ncbi:MAG: hypothetical protein J1F61_02585 [Clostridiales bacterium]|nr:hypothetical protein [Clostridiales bacterium]
MNTNLDKLMLFLNLTSPQVSNEKKEKEVFKARIEDLNVSDYHKFNMKAIVESARTENQMLVDLGNYIIANGLI